MDNIDVINKYILEQIGKSKLNEEVAFDILKMLNSCASGDIAVIGIACRFPGAKCKEIFWDNIKNEFSNICEFPESRMKDVNAFYNISQDNTSDLYSKSGYLDEIDKFDAGFFRISSKEASYMEPVQRIFLETAYEVLEDGGYGGNKACGSRTGVYLGLDTTGKLYRYIDLVGVADELSITGSVTGVISSRISYILNLKGPSIVIDTACSSGLVALHTACKALTNNDCDMAIAGGININVFPYLKSMMVGIESEDDVLRAFDKNAKGTVWGEGVGALLLKPLNKAISARDNIYAVIKGSAVNNDGTSNGITAPNVEAQTDVIIKAWENAGIIPENISYIETHGTGTVLGDPIEIKGLNNAFKKFTSKKQFCGIGSVKTNIGHTVGASGIASVIKVIMAMKNKTIPATLNFTEINPHMLLHDTPLYINDVLRPWETEGTRRLAGISSFGFSGTNCHMVIEESPELKETESDDRGNHILVLSAKSENALWESLHKYDELLNNSTINLRDICYTLCTGRGHYNYRLAIVGLDKKDLLEKLSRIKFKQFDSLNIEGVHFGLHKVVSDKIVQRMKGEIAQSEKIQMTNASLLKIEEIFRGESGSPLELLNDLCKLYTTGADLDWELFYKNQKRYKVSLPTYPYQRLRHWIEKSEDDKSSANIDKKLLHPLLDEQLSNSLNEIVYSTELSVDRYWVLSDHVLMGNNTVPGTTYLEIAWATAKEYFKSCKIRLADIIFYTPLVVNPGDRRIIHTVLRKFDESLEFTIASRKVSNYEDRDWVVHAKGKTFRLDEAEEETNNIDELKTKCGKNVKKVDMSAAKGAFKFGPRWWNIKKIYFDDREALGEFELDNSFALDVEQYQLHPSLIDNAVNIISQHAGNGMYLPLSYKSMKVYSKIPLNIYSYVIRKDDKGFDSEIAVFDVCILDNKGNVLVKIEDYTVKRLNEAELRFKELSNEKDLFYKIGWVKNESGEKKELNSSKVLVLKGNSDFSDKMTLKLKENAAKVIEVRIGEEFEVCSDSEIIINGKENDYHKLMDTVRDLGIDKIIHMFTLADAGAIYNGDDLNSAVERGVFSLYYLTKAIIESRIRDNLDIVLISDYAYEVSGNEKEIKPHNAAFLSMGRVVSQEYGKLKCRSIDIDANTSVECIVEEVKRIVPHKKVAYRGVVRYFEELTSLDIRSSKTGKIQLKSSGVYIITGGTGGLGLEIAKYLSSREKVKIALINRSILPDKCEWDSIIAKQSDTKVIRKIEVIKELEKSGSEVFCISADISNVQQMKETIESLKQKFGHINGIIHSAGIAGDGFIIKKENHVFESVISPKITGTYILDKLTENEDLDFFVMFSSIASLLGGLGQSDYTAANAYLDSFSAFRNKLGRKALAICWPAWKDVGMAVDYKSNKDNYIFKAISTSDAIRAFESALNSDVNNVIISKIDSSRLSEFYKNMNIEISSNLKNLMEVADQSPNSSGERVVSRKSVGNVILKGRANKEYTKTEIEMGKLWSEILGEKELNIFDSFYDLGGDSIQTMQLHRILETIYPNLLDVTDVFKYSSISRMAEYIDSKTGIKSKDEKEDSGNKDDTDDIDSILSRLETGELSISDAQRLYEQRGR